MEEKENEVYLPQHIMFMKVALAVVIIRRKPAGVSAAQYTHTLSLQFSQLQIDWKEKAVQLQSELLRARQELVCGQIQSGLSSLWQSRVVNECEMLDNSSLELSKSNSPLSSTDDQETTVKINSETSTTLEERLTLHVKFLQSIAGLQSCHTQLSSMILCDLRSTLRDSLANTITELSEALSSQWLPNVPHIKQVCEELVDKTVGLLKSGRLLEPHSNDICKACSVLLKAIIGNLSSTHQYTLKSDDRSLLQKMLLNLAQLQDLYSQAVQQLIEFITSAVISLQNCIEDPSLLDPVMVECLGVVIETLQLLAATPKQHCYVPQSVLTALDELVDGPVLTIADCFPLVSYSVWRTHAMLTAISTQ